MHFCACCGVIPFVLRFYRPVSGHLISPFSQMGSLQGGGGTWDCGGVGCGIGLGGSVAHGFCGITIRSFASDVGGDNERGGAVVAGRQGFWEFCF